MKKLLFVLLLLASFTNMLHAQLPAQETFNKELYTLMMAYPSKFESIKGKMIDDDWGITDYECTVKLTGTKDAHLWSDDDKDVPVLHFTCTIAEGISLADAKKLYKQWQTLLGSAKLAGAPLKLETAKEEKAYIELSSVYKWANPASIAANYMGFKPRLIMNRHRGETFRLVLDIYP